ncbi:MAG: hypothetical protein AB4040_16270 [Synechococcus sp.]
MEVIAFRVLGGANMLHPNADLASPSILPAPEDNGMEKSSGLVIDKINCQ